MWRRRETAALLKRFPAPDEPFAGDYTERHAHFLQAVFAEPTLLEPFVRGKALPRGYGVGFDERVVEYPWLLAANPRGRVLDAGSVLNDALVLDRFLPSFGMDNTSYGSPIARAEDPGAALELAVGELLRVLTPDGILLVSVPFGAPEDHGWFRQFGETELDELCRMLEPAEITTQFFRYSGDGWRRATRDEAADARYRPATAPAAEDRAAAARTVACVRAILRTSERSR